MASNVGCISHADLEVTSNTLVPADLREVARRSLLHGMTDLEKRLARDQAWAKTPKPRVNVSPPTDIPNVADLLGRTNLLFDLTHLALQTDSTRLVTIMLGGSTYVPPIPSRSRRSGWRATAPCALSSSSTRA